MRNNQRTNKMDFNTIMRYLHKKIYLLTSLFISMALPLSLLTSVVNAIGEPCPNLFTEYQHGQNINTSNIVPASNGGAWYASGIENGQRYINKINANGQIMRHPTPHPVVQMTKTNDGTIWFIFNDSSGQGVTRMNNDGTFTDFTIGTGMQPIQIAFSPDGALWVSAIVLNNHQTNILRLINGQVVDTYTISTSPQTANSRVYSMVSGPDGKLWFTYRGDGDNYTNRIGRIEQATGTLKLFNFDEKYGQNGYFNKIVKGADGALWADASRDGIGYLDRITTDGVLTEYSDRSFGMYIEDMISTSNGSIWFTNNDDGIGVIDIFTHQADLYHTRSTSGIGSPQAFSITEDIEHSIWVTQLTSDSLVKIASRPTLNTPYLTGLSGYTNTPTFKWDKIQGASFYKVCRDGVVIDIVNRLNYVDNNVSDGPHDYDVVAFDGNGSLSSPGHYYAIYVDNTPPTVSNLTLNPRTIIVSGNLKVMADVADSRSGISNGEYFIDKDPGLGKGLPMIYDTASQKISITRGVSRGSLSLGNHTFNVRTKDNAGNWSAVASKSFIYL